MLEYNQVKPGKIINFEGEPFTVLSSHVFRKQQRKPVNQTKLKNVITGKVIEHSFGSSDKVALADLEKRPIKYLYNKDNRQAGQTEYWFSAENNPGDRFTLSADVLGDALKFMKQNELVDAIIYNEEIIGVELPIKMVFKVTEAPPNFRGNTAGGADKQVTIETGANVTTPMFIEVGEMIVVNTTTGEYVERAKN